MVSDPPPLIQCTPATFNANKQFAGNRPLCWKRQKRINSLTFLFMLESPVWVKLQCKANNMYLRKRVVQLCCTFFCAAIFWTHAPRGVTSLRLGASPVFGAKSCVKTVFTTILGYFGLGCPLLPLYDSWFCQSLSCKNGQKARHVLKSQILAAILKSLCANIGWLPEKWSITLGVQCAGCSN